MSDSGCNDDLLTGVGATPGALMLARRGFSALWHGEQPRVVELGVDDTTIDSQVRAGRLEIDAAGRLIGVHGLSARQTPHRIEHENGAVHTWCAFDAIGIPAALGIDATAVTTCPACGAELRVVLAGGVPRDTNALRLWLPTSDCAHLVDDFCQHTNLYCDAEHLAAIVPAGTPGEAATVSEAATIGRDTWSDVSTILQSSTET